MTTTRWKGDGNGETPGITISFPQQSQRNLGLHRHDAATDVDVVVSGTTVLVSLPVGTLAAASKLVNRMWEMDQLLLCGGRYKLLWEHDTSRDVDIESLVKVLRLCCGETVKVGVKGGECCAVVATLFRLDVWCARTVVAELCNFAVEQAQRDVMFGATLLKACSRYPECCDQQLCALDTRLAKVLLTEERICHDYPVVVDECLMAIDPRYLGVAEYGRPRTKWSEFSIRTRYIRFHTDLQAQEKEAIIKCDLGSFTREELDVLEELGVLKPGTIMSLCGSPPEETEINKSNKVDRFRQQSLSCVCSM